VSVLLDYQKPELVHLTIKDDGIGSAGTGSGFGLMGISERVASLNGTLDIKSAPDQGFAMPNQTIVSQNTEISNNY